MSDELLSFLKKYDSTGLKDDSGKAVFTHTSLQPRASYNIPLEARDQLHQLMAAALCDNQPIHLTEAPLPITAIKADIDLKYPLDRSNRQHNEGHIKELLKLYAKAIVTYVDLPPQFDIDAYVFQRKTPYPSKGNMKDGIHIMYPDICCDVEIQHAIRTEVLKKLDLFLKNPKLGVLDVKNTNDDVVDLSVISRNPWLMFGSRKPGTKPYLLHNVYRVRYDEASTSYETRTLENGEQVEVPDFQLDDNDFSTVEVNSKGVDNVYQMITRLSVHNVPEESTFPIRDSLRYVIEGAAAKKAKPARATGYRSSAMKKQTMLRIDEDERKSQIEEAIKLVELLALWRAEAYAPWIEVGLCLHNISPSLQDTWIKFSKRSDSWKDSDADRWYGFGQSNSGLNIGTLHRWARLDNPDKYKAIRGDFLESLMMCSVTGATQDVAKVIYKMFQHQYVCLDAKGKKWAEFVNHTWKITEDGISLKKRLGKDVLFEYFNLIGKYNSLAMAAISNTNNNNLEDENRYHQNVKVLTDVSYKLRDITFKDKLMKECTILFHDQKFEANLDENPYLVGLENGVYDLKENIFRDGRPEDNVSLTTGNDYPEFNDSDIDIERETSSIEEVQAIFNFMQQVLPIAPVRRYFWKFLASLLQGYNTDEKFHILTGTGGNGKSKVIELLELAFGNYCFKLPITLITGKRSQSGQATPELIMGKKARFGSMQEPDEGAKINTGLMKELSGNDKMFLRDLYASGEQFKPQFSLALLCNNKPKMTSDDEGTWRRMVVIDFISKFVEGTPRGPYEFKRDTELVNNFPDWAPWFFVIMTLFYKVYKSEGLVPPDEVSAATRDYRKDSDVYSRFIDDYFVQDEHGCVSLESSYLHFKEWFEAEYGETVPARREYKKTVETILNKKYTINGKNGWYGWSLKNTVNVNSDTSDSSPIGLSLGPDKIKSEAKVEAKVDAKVEAKVDAKVEAKVDAKDVTKDVTKDATKDATKDGTKGNVELKKPSISVSIKKTHT